MAFNCPIRKTSSWQGGSAYLPEEEYFKANNAMKALAEGTSLFVSGHIRWDIK